MRASGKRDNTAIVFSPDSGGYGPATDMDPLRGSLVSYSKTDEQRAPMFHQGSLALPEALRRNFDAADTNHDGFIDPAEDLALRERNQNRSPQTASRIP